MFSKYSYLLKICTIKYIYRAQLLVENFAIKCIYWTQLLAESLYYKTHLLNTITCWKFVLYNIYSRDGLKIKYKLIYPSYVNVNNM
jgi:hypothetical protein